MTATLEHVNFTVPDPDHTADWLCRLFGWHVRWTGTAINGGYTVHVGTDDQYLAVYTGPGGAKNQQKATTESYSQTGGLNHIGIVVDDLDATERAVEDLGFKTHSHADYEPGKRFYFHDDVGVEYEVVCYA